MKKLLLPIVALLAFASVGFSQNCGSCDPCAGLIYVCESEYDDYKADRDANCGPGTTMEVFIVEGC